MHLTVSFLFLAALAAPTLARPSSEPTPTASNSAAQRELAAFLASHDVKTAREPSRPPDPAHVRSAMPAAAEPASYEPAPAPRQSPDPRAPLPAAFRVDHTRMHYDTPGDGSLWARGASYKASFDSAGMTCYPLFGGRQPRHLPLALSPDSVTLGGDALEMSDAPSAVRSGDRVEIDRGSFTERYELAPQSLEQLFVFPTLPGAGDLVVHIRIAPTDEVVEIVATDAGLEIRSELGRVSYGRAVAIDGRGRRVDAETTSADGAITIRVDAAFLADATMPLVIDPIVTPLGIDTTSYDNYSPDVAYDPTTERWLVVYAETATAGDQDVYYVILNLAGASMWGGYVNSNLASWWYASCANLQWAQQFLVVCNVNSGGYTIRGRTIQAAVFGIGNEFFISGNESGDKWYPDVGAEFGSDGQYCVVYERAYSSNDHDILASMVNSSSQLTSGTIYLSNSGGTYDTLPSIAKQTTGGNWMIAWARTANGSSSDIWGGRISHSGGITLNPFQISSGGYDWLASVSSPAASPSRTMIAFARFYGSDYDIHVAVQDGATPIATANVSTMQGGLTFLKNQTYPHVDSDGDHFILGYSEQDTLGAHEHNVYVDELYVHGSSIGLLQSHVTLAATSLREVGPRIAAKRSNSGPTSRYLMAWTRETSTGNNDIHGAIFDGSPVRSVSTFCHGDTAAACPCGNAGFTGHGCANSVTSNGGQMWLTGNVAPAGDTATLQASLLPQTAACLFFQGTTAGAPAFFGDGLRCVSGTVVRIGTKTAVFGAVSYPGPGDLPVHVQGGVPFTGGLRTYQVWYRNAAAYCTASTFNLTNGLIVNWAN